MNSKNNILLGLDADNKKLTDEVIFAMHQDIEAMISICSQQLIKNRKTEDAATMEKSGFLIRDTTAKQLQDIIDDDENSLALVFKRNTATLFGMYVKDGVRGSGVGLALVNFVKDYAKKNHVKHLYLGCNAQNLGAVKLYKKCGFKVYGTRPDYTKIGSKFYDDLIMMCEL